MFILLLCYDVIFSHNVGLWWKGFLILEPRSYEHDIRGAKFLSPMLWTNVKEDLNLLKKGYL